MGGVAVVFVLLAGAYAGGPTYAQEAPATDICAGYPTFTALGTAAGMRTLETWPGVTLFDVDGALPGAQAEVASPGGSTAWSGAAYTTSAGVAGLAGVDPSQVPIFAVSSHPTKPESKSAQPGSDVQAKSDAQSSSSSAVAGTPPSENGSTGQASASAVASCATDGTVRAVAESKANAIDIKDVLRIGAVTARAEAARDAAGKQTLAGSMEVEGATVLGQRVAITDQGVVVAGSKTPVAEPLTKALTEAGVTVRYVAAVQDKETGSVMSPGLEIVVTGEVEGVGTGPSSTTYTFGRALAVATAAPGDAVPAADDASVDFTPSPSAELPSGEAAAPVAPTTPSSPSDGAPAPESDGTGAVQLASARLADVSLATSYGVAVGALLLLVLSVLFKRVGVRLRWR